MARVIVAVLSMVFVVGCAGEDLAGGAPICCLDAVSGELLRGPGCTGSSEVDVDGEAAVAVRLCATAPSCTASCDSVLAPEQESCLRACENPRFRTP